MRAAWLNAAAAALLGGPASAATLDASGYLKDIWEYSRSTLDDRPWNLNTSRARLTLDAGASVFKAHVDYDQEVLAGSYFRTAEYATVGLNEPPHWLSSEQ